MPETCLYHGEVVHRRMRPVTHELRYRVFNLFADVDELSALPERARLFSYNRFNLFSLSDRDHGPGDGTPIAEHAWRLVRQSVRGGEVQRIFMFCYPRVLGYVFNPLTVYYGFDAHGRPRVTIYEVNNTFGGRHSYVLPVDGPPQSAAKRFYVSPFNAVEGRYGFRFSVPGERMALGVTLAVDGSPVLKAYVSGTRRPFSDALLLRSFASVPFLTLKVIAAIHVQAARLWRKGLRPRPRPAAPNHTIDILPKVSPNP
jgi:hypothetical protein